MKIFKTSIKAILFVMLLWTSSFADCSYELFSISSAKNTRIIDFINQLSDECGFSIIVTDSITEKFLKKSLNKTNLKNLTIDEVLNIILTENNLSYKLENNLLKISYLTTKVFEIDYILSQRKSSGSTDVTLSSSSVIDGKKGGGTPPSQTGMKIESTDEVKFWETLDTEFQNILNAPQDAYKANLPIINKNAGLITVTATEKQMKRFEAYLKKLQEKVQLQVLIDVQLLTVVMDKGKTTGVNWKQLYALQNIDISASATFDPTHGGSSSVIKVGEQGKLSEIIKFLKTQGDVYSISNPKVLTLNNQPALITAGTEYFYKLTSTQTLGGGTGAGTQSANEEVQSVFSGVLLTITPEISDDKTITLKINPSLSETTTGISSQNNARTMPPDLNRRQLSSVVTVKDGNRIILGGLINTKNTVEVNKVPILGDIPLLNTLFKYTEKVKHIEELVIIIEPHIIHKSKNTISLSDLGYKGMNNKILLKEIDSHDGLTLQKADKKVGYKVDE